MTVLSAFLEFIFNKLKKCMVRFTTNINDNNVIKTVNYIQKTGER